MTIKDESNINELLDTLSKANDTELEVGIFETSFKDSKGNLTIYGKALVNEYGASIEKDLKDGGKSYIDIPERSFIRSSFDKNQTKIDNSISEMLDDLVAGELTLDEMLLITGENSVRMIRDQIQSSVPPPNAPSTLAQKKGDTTLIDTGEMLKSVDWRVLDRLGGVKDV